MRRRSENRERCRRKHQGGGEEKTKTKKKERKKQRKKGRKEGDRRRRKGVKELLHTTLLVLPFPSVGDPPGI